MKGEITELKEKQSQGRTWKSERGVCRVSIREAESLGCSGSWLGWDNLVGGRRIALETEEEDWLDLSVL